MRKYQIIILGAVSVTIIAIFYYSVTQREDPQVFIKQVQDARKKTNIFMKTSQESPFYPIGQQDFSGLSYYPPDINFRVRAVLDPIPGRDILTLQTSDGEETNYIKYAYATFRLEGKECNLLILRLLPITDQNQFFLPFTDETSAVETYGAGRYLDLRFPPGSQSVTLDFNQAYNPFCAYNEKFSCPLPPSQNYLTIPIRAGEKSPS